MKKKMSLFIGIFVFISSALFSQTLMIYGIENVYLDMEVNDFVRRYATSIEINNSDNKLSDIRQFYVGNYGRSEGIELSFFRNKLYFVRMMFKSDRFPIQDFSNQIQSIYGEFDEIREEDQSNSIYYMQKSKRIILTRHFSNNLKIDIYITEVYSGDRLINQTYTCFYINPVVSEEIRRMTQ